MRGLTTAHVGMVHVASHTLHHGDRASTLLPAVGERLGAVCGADTVDHRRPHGLGYTSNPPGDSARIHLHLRVGDGDVDWSELFDALRSTGFLDREDAVLVSNVFAGDETALETSRFQLGRPVGREGRCGRGYGGRTDGPWTPGRPSLEGPGG